MAGILRMSGFVFYYGKPKQDHRRSFAPILTFGESAPVPRDLPISTARAEAGGVLVAVRDSGPRLTSAQVRQAAKVVLDIRLLSAGYSPIPVMPRNAGCDIGPLMTGACAGAASGAGIRFSNGICGAGFPTIGPLRTKPPRPPPCPPPPPRARTGVDPTTQATANTTTKRRCMISLLVLLSPPSCTPPNHFDRKRLDPYCLDLSGLATIGEVHLHITAQRPPRADRERVADDQHPDHQFRVNRWPTSAGIVGRELSADPHQVENHCSRKPSTTSATKSAKSRRARAHAHRHMNDIGEQMKAACSDRSGHRLWAQSGAAPHWPADVTRQTVFPTSSAIKRAPVLSTATPTGRPRASPSALRNPVTTSSALPFGRPPLNGTNTTL